MLPAELLRMRRRQGKIIPLYAGQNHLTLAKTMISVFQASINKKQGELRSALGRCEELGYNFKLVRGIAAVLEERCAFETKASFNPLEARGAVFDEVGDRIIVSDKERKQVLAAAASKIGVAINDLEESLYADLVEEQVLIEFDAPDPMELLGEYNFALTLAILIQARRIELTYGGREGAIEPKASLGRSRTQEKSGLFKTVVEPRPSKRAGQSAIEMEMMLSSLMLRGRWELSAEQRHNGKVYLLELSRERDGGLVTPSSLRQRLAAISQSKASPRERSPDEIVLLEEMAAGLGITEARTREMLRQARRDYVDLGGVFITSTMLRELERALERSPDMRLSTITEILSRLGCRKPIQVLEALGYSVEWEKNRDLSRVYRLKRS